MIILVVAIGLVAVTFLFMLAEVYFERDLPRATWKGFVIAVALFILCYEVFK
jgi:hypothetical protein